MGAGTRTLVSARAVCTLVHWAIFPPLIHVFPPQITITCSLDHFQHFLSSFSLSLAVISTSRTSGFEYSGFHTHVESLSTFYLVSSLLHSACFLQDPPRLRHLQTLLACVGSGAFHSRHEHILFMHWLTGPLPPSGVVTTFTTKIPSTSLYLEVTSLQ